MLNSLRFSHNSQDSVSDLLIFPRDRITLEFAKSLAGKGLFRHVYVGPNIDGMQKLMFMKSLLFPARYLFRISKLLHPNSYDNVFGQSWTQLILTRKLSVANEFCFIEEGLSSYTDRAYNIKYRRNFIRFLLFYLGNILNYNLSYSIYLNNPKMYKGTCDRVYKFPIISESLFEKIKNGMPNYSAYYGNKGFIYLGVPFYGLLDLQSPNNEKSQNIESICESLNEEIFNYVGLDKLLYRKHPLEETNNIVDLISIDNGDVIWEVICKGLDDDICIINYFSTAAFTPKLLYNKEPRIVFLYKLIGLKLLHGDGLVKDLKDLYIDSTKIIVPETIQELLSFVDEK